MPAVNAMKMKLCAALLALTVIVPVTVHADITPAGENPAAAAKKGRPRIALVLSGGGARGLAHVGVFKALEKMRVPYDCIVGTSMGAIAGGAFATGISVPDAERMVEQADWTAVFADKPQRANIPYFRKFEDYQPYFAFTLTLKDMKLMTPRNVVGVQNIGLFFRELTGARAVNSFDSLPVPYRAVGTDIVSGEPVVLDSGTLAEAMRASMTVPGVFPPIPYKGHLLVDGGIAMNLPVSVGRQLCGDVVIAVNVSSPGLTRNELTSFFSIGQQVINIGMQRNLTEQLALLGPRDILLTPDLEGYTSIDFEKVGELVRIGEKAVEDHAAAFAPYQLSESDYAAWRHAVDARKPPPPVVNKVQIAATRWVNPDVMEDLLKVKAGEPFDMVALHNNIDRVYARGDFSSVSYDLVRQHDGQADVLVTPEEKSGRDFVRFGLSLYSDFRGDAEFSALVSLRRAWLNRLDGEWRTDLQLGRSNDIYSEWYQPASLGSEFFVAPHVIYQDEYRDLRYRDVLKLEYEYKNIGGGLELGSVFGRWGEFRAGVMHSSSSVDSSSLFTDPRQRFDQGGYTFRGTYDQLDDTHFPHRGGVARLNYFKSSHDLGADQVYDRLEFAGGHAYTWNRNTLLFSTRVGSGLGTTLPYYNDFALGGLFNLSAYPPHFFEGSNLFLGSAMLYRRVSDLPSGVGKGIYAGTVLEGGRVWESSSGRPDFSGLPVSGSIFAAADTVLGPFYLLGALGDRAHSAIYMALGVSF